jgi:acetyl-CoA decarbonylase/synthase, CODH/ACS complex subunit gamma
MPLTGIDIFKLLPKTNCKACGEPTCLAFAMKLAASKAQLAACPYLSEEAKTRLNEAATPPILPVTIGVGEGALKVGGETVMFRHEKRFENPPGLALLVSDSMTETEIAGRLERFTKLRFERIGMNLSGNLVAVRADSGDSARFAALVKRVAAKVDAGLILMSLSPDLLTAGLAACPGRRPLLYAATPENAEKVAELARSSACPLAAKASSLEQLAELTARLTGLGVKDIVLDSGARTLRRAFEDQVIIRNAALAKKFRPLGFPTILFPGEISSDPMLEAVMASVFIAKYGGIVVLSDFQGESLYPLLVERQNIFTDPQRPLATGEGIYPIGEPGADSPVLITSNFSLTYFLVSGEVENSRVPSWLLVKDTEGLSVVTAWAAGKFVADTIAPFIKRCGIADKVNHRKLVIPGHLAPESGALEEELPDWQIIVGPKDGAAIPAYLKTWRAREG